MADLFKLTSLNVGGLNNFHKRRTLLTWCWKRKADVIFFQETHSKKETEKQWINEWGGKMFVSLGSPNSYGVAVLIRNGFNYSIQKTITDPMGRFIILKMNIEDKMYTLINIYHIDTDEIPGFFLLLKNHIFIVRSEDTIFYLSRVRILVSPWLLT